MTLTFENLPSDMLARLKERAAAQGLSVEEVALEAMKRGLGGAAAGKKRDFSDIAGTWVEDPEFDEAIKDFERIDPELWK